MSENKSNYFYCYSKRLKDFLKSRGMNYITKAINPKSECMFYLFEKSSVLDENIKLWNEVKEK